MLEEGEGLSVSTGGSWFRVYGCLGHVNVHRRTGSCCLGRPRGDVGLATCGKLVARPPHSSLLL
jgi:hypothetical protein